ncbi:MAG: DUF6171 family protein [Spirochaetaceae bacterium]|nr:DUF6171 family protein [Spirochaetaceae bacterium]
MLPGRMPPECPRCGGWGGGEFSPEGMAKLAAELPLPALLRAEEAVVEGRLARCSRCPALREQVLCAYCGCFVIFRARIAKGCCPHPGGDRWVAPSCSIEA